MTVQTYAAEVRRTLADLPPATYDELLEDLDDHLAEAAAELGVGAGGDLQTALGPPQEYARELRRAAGLAAEPVVAPATSARLRSQVDRLAASDPVRAALAFLPELRPAWWVLRAWLAVVALSFVTGPRSLLLPFGLLLSVPVVAAAIVLSVRLGRRAQARPPVEPGRRLLVLAGNAALGLVALLVLGGVAQSGTGSSYADPAPYAGPGPTLTRADGTPITNLFPYSSDGQPLSGVLLYDQDGRPVDNLSTSRAEDGRTLERVLPSGQAPPPSNSYPQQQRLASDGTDPLAPPQVLMPDATPSPSPTESSAPSATPSASASPPASPSPTSSPRRSVAPSASPAGSPRPGPVPTR